MRHRVPYLTEEAIEHDATALLAEYRHAHGVTLGPPIPVEDIIEKHLQLSIDFDDMHAQHGVPRPASGDPGILGTIYADRSIFVDESLDPVEHPTQEGRYRFTLAHEGGGHWRLHRSLLMSDTAQSSFLNEASTGTWICRTTQAKAREEWQADFYASCLLLPREMVFAAWENLFPDHKRRVLLPLIPNDRPFDESDRRFDLLGGDVARVSEDRVLAQVCEPLARRFAVSRAAMRIRLEKLGLLRHSVPGQQPLFIDGLSPFEEPAQC